MKQKMILTVCLAVLGMLSVKAQQTYYVRAYATSAVGTQYSPQTITLTTVGNAPTSGDNPPVFVRKR